MQNNQVLMTTSIRTRFTSGSSVRQRYVTLHRSQKLWESHKIKCGCSVWREVWRSCCWGEEQDSSVLRRPGRPRSQGPTKPSHTPPDSHTASVSIHLMYFQKYIYCKNSVLFLQKSKTWVHQYRRLFYQQQCHSGHVNPATRLGQSAHVCAWQSCERTHCIRMLSPWFQDVREKQSASTRQLLPHFP